MTVETITINQGKAMDLFQEVKKILKALTWGVSAEGLGSGEGTECLEEAVIWLSCHLFTRNRSATMSKH